MRISVVALVAVIGCRAGPAPTADRASKSVLQTYCDQLQAYRSDPSGLRNSFYTADLELRLYQMDAPGIYRQMSDADRALLRGCEELLGDASGRALVDDATVRLVRVTQETDDAALRVHALALLAYAFALKRDHSELRVVAQPPAGSLQGLLLDMTYARIAASWAHQHDRLMGSNRMLPVRLRVLIQDSRRLAGYPALKAEFVELWRRDEGAGGENPGSFEPLQVELPLRSQLAEAIRFKDRAVQEQASGGSAPVALANFVNALDRFVFIVETASERERTENREALDCVPMILNEIARLALADK